MLWHIISLQFERYEKQHSYLDICKSKMFILVDSFNLKKKKVFIYLNITYHVIRDVHVELGPSKRVVYLSVHVLMYLVVLVLSNYAHNECNNVI